MSSQQVDPEVTATNAGLFSNLPIEIFDFYILGILPLWALGKLRKLNKGFWRQKIDDYLETKFKTYVGRYMDDVEEFREAMRVTGAIISGSTALSFISGDESWSAKDLDIYVPVGHSDALVRYLVDEEGYQPSNDWTRPHPYDNNPNYITCPKNVSGMTKTRESTGEKVKVDVVECHHKDPRHCITCFHSTVVMNYIAHDYVRVLYPVLTFKHSGYELRESLQHPLQDREKKCMEKYQDRGYTIVYDSWKLGDEGKIACSLSCPSITRPLKGRMSSSLVIDGDAASFALRIQRTAISSPRLHYASQPENQPRIWKEPDFQEMLREVLNRRSLDHTDGNLLLNQLLKACIREGKEALTYKIRVPGSDDTFWDDAMAVRYPAWKLDLLDIYHWTLRTRCRNPLCRRSETYGSYPELGYGAKKLLEGLILGNSSMCIPIHRYK
ncbi:hypothetical protein BT69DRAFT_1347032 [Atractiella rhizophila]|nr:hypothetical protein BT69DRAFT_1347032 [Atractiella rhizophila]